jgi:hypothetical protein
MGSLKEKLLSPMVRGQVLDDCVVVIDQEVDSKSGLTGMGIKAAYAMVKAVKPGIIRESMDNLLDDFAGRVEPFFGEWQRAANKMPLGAFLSSRREDVANALLGITDDRAKKARGVLLKAYQKLRPMGQRHVEEAVPRIGQLMEKYAG